MFRIFYIKTLRPQKIEDKGRYESIRRVLKENTIYRFYQAKPALPRTFWSDGRPEVNVCAVVGENGMGKSSLLELMLRLVNNTAYALKNGIDHSKSNNPRFVRDVFAELCFETDEGIFTIIQKDNIVEFHHGRKILWRYDHTKRKRLSKGFVKKTDGCVEDFSKYHLSNLFYTIVVNYSFYSYNTEDYRREMIWDNDELEEGEKSDEIFDEDRCWLSGIFHKNDGYQMPLVLNPYRSVGNLNINNENELTQNRMFLLAIAKDSPLKSIWSNKVPYSFCFDVKTDFLPMGSGMIYTSKMVRLEMMYIRYISDWKKESEKVEALGKIIIEIWNKCLGFRLDEKKAGMDDKDWKAALNYVVYKTIKISRNYGKFSHFQDGIVDIDKRDKKERLLIEEYIKLLHDDNTHITLKLIRAIAFIKFDHYGSKMRRKRGETRLEENEILLTDFGKRIKNCIGDENHHNPTNRDDGLNDIEWKDEKLLPASCFHTDMRLKLSNQEVSREDDKNYVMYSSLSSGEKQVVNTLCTAVYHIYNLKTKWETNNVSPKEVDVKYKYVNLIFDELELYFHPKYQTMLVGMLINAIKSLDLSNYFKGINIIFATHSPFILSDIPVQNILGLEHGKPVKLKNIENTFCANVYDILASGFFMDKFVGDFAERKFEELVKKLNRNKKLSPRERMLTREMIEVIGDDFLKWKLLDLLDEKQS